MCEPCEPTDQPKKQKRGAEAFFFSRGPGTYRVSKPLPVEARQKLVGLLAAADVTSGMVLLRGGVSACRNDTDHEELFRQESYFAYLTGVLEPDCWATIELPSGRSTLFVPRLGPEYAIWMGEIKSADAFRQRYHMDKAAYTDELVEVVQAALTECAPSAAIHVMSGTNTDSGANLAESLPTTEGVPKGARVVDDVLYDVLAECRTCKSAAELDLMQYVSWVTSAAHVEVMREVRRDTHRVHAYTRTYMHMSK